MKTQAAVVGNFDVHWIGAIPPEPMVATFGSADANAVVVIHREPAQADRVFVYHCRGPVKVWPVPEYLRSEPASPGIRRRLQRAVAFVDPLPYQAMPFLKRPQAKELDSLLRDGDHHVVIALSEFVGPVEAAEVIGRWKRRGVHFHITDIPAACDDSPVLLYRVLARLVRTDEPWVRECDSTGEENDEKEWPENAPD